MRHFFDVFELFCVNRFIKLESVIFLIESPHMKHKHCFAIKVDCEEDERRDSVDSHGVGSKFDGSCDDINPHMGDEMVGHMVVAGLVCIFRIVCAHEIEENTESCLRKKSNEMIKFLPEHDETCGGANHGSYDRKGETTGFAMEKIKAAGDEKEAEEIEKYADFAPDEFQRCKHKAHTDNYRNGTFKSELIFFHL